jgi:hypothetical protein
MSRTIQIAPAGVHAVVRLSANNALQTGASFAIYDSTGTKVIEQWTMSAGVAGYSDYTVGTPPAQLCGGSISWRVIVCSHDPTITTGTIDITVFQGSDACAMTPVAHYALTAVPDCATGSVIPIQGSGDFTCS